MADQIEVDVYCRAVGCDKPSVAVVSTLAHGWVSFCEGHAVLQIGFEHGVTA